MFKRRRGSGDTFGVGPQVDPDATVGVDLLLDCISESTDPVHEPPEGISDRRRSAKLAMVERLGIDPAEFAETYDLGRDYQLDHPLSQVDRTLDRAFVPESLLAAVIVAVAPVVEGLAANRLARYTTRAAARARMTSDHRLVGAGMRAHALTIASRSGSDRRDDMVGLAPIAVAAREVMSGDDPLGELARLSSGEDAAFVRRFAARDDLTLAAFGWIEVEVPHGIWIVPDQ